jgi:hypothetical protein
VTSQTQTSATASEHATTEEDFVHLALRAAEHHPILKAVYMGPPGWMEEAQRDPGEPATLIGLAHDLASRADAAGDPYVAGQARSVAVQLELSQGRALRYDQKVEALLGVPVAPIDQDAMTRLHDEIVDLAAGDVVHWESSRLVTGEAKWDEAMQAYAEGRRYAFGGRFPLEVGENLELIRIADELWSVNLSWYPPRRMTFEVNVSTPRAPETVWFEVTHNIYPGDYLHLAVLQQHTFLKRGHVAASIKLKNAPESVVSEGIEETALLRLIANPSRDLVLATKLEWLRRLATFKGALAHQVEGRRDEEVLATMARDGFMDPARAAFQLRLIKHPLWGPYQYTYILGRALVKEADRRAQAKNPAAYLEYLYGGLHTPQTFLPGLDQIPSA